MRNVGGKAGILVLFEGFFWDNGKENGNYYSKLVLYSDNGKENGNYYLGFNVGGQAGGFINKKFFHPSSIRNQAGVCVD